MHDVLFVNYPRTTFLPKGSPGIVYKKYIMYTLGKKVILGWFTNNASCIP
jgi:hypothetical protein